MSKRDKKTEAELLGEMFQVKIKKKGEKKDKSS